MSSPVLCTPGMEPPPEPPPPARASAPTSAETKAAWSGFMKQSRAAQSAKKIAKPRGPVPRDEFGLKQWDDIKGEWQSSGPADDVADGTDSAAESDGDGAGASADGASSAKRKRTRPPRAFQATWKELLTTLVCISILVAGAKCAVREDCPGCPACARMFYEDCQLRGEKNNFVTGDTARGARRVRKHLIARLLSPGKRLPLVQILKNGRQCRPRNNIK